MQSLYPSDSLIQVSLILLFIQDLWDTHTSPCHNVSEEFSSKPRVDTPKVLASDPNPSILALPA